MATVISEIEPGTVVPYQDLRDFIEIVDALGELRRADGANQHLEIGTISALSRESKFTPTVLCDKIPGLEPGFRILLNPLHSFNRAALAYGLPVGLSRGEYTEVGPAKWASAAPIPPRTVTSGPVMENVQEGERVDLTRFPLPYWHEGDGGPYVGTGDAVITKDPDSDWVNVGAYRVMYIDPQHVAIWINQLHDGRLHRDRWFRQGKPCPVLISLGHDPLLFALASHSFPEGTSEYDLMGGLRGEPLDVIIEPHTGLPMPARAELVLAGQIMPDDQRSEGPFGEWSGYFTGKRNQPVVQVQAAYHRNQPIMLGNPPGRPPYQPSAGRYLAIIQSETTLDTIRKIVPGVKDVYTHSFAGASGITAISIDQRYPGHAREAGMAMAMRGNYLAIIVVDDDVNIRDVNELFWALCTRCDPVKDFETVTNCPVTALDPRIAPGALPVMSRVIMDATRPYAWKDEYPKPVQIAPELRQEVQTKWAHVIA